MDVSFVVSNKSTLANFNCVDGTSSTSLLDAVTLSERGALLVNNQHSSALLISERGSASQSLLLHEAVSYAGICSASGVVVVVGGQSASGGVRDTVQYLPANGNKFQVSLATLVDAAERVAVTSDGGVHVFAAGGRKADGSASDQLIRWNVVLSRQDVLAMPIVQRLAVGRWEIAACAVLDRVVLVGGFGSDGAPRKDVEVLRLDRDTPSLHLALAEPRGGMVCSTIGKRIVFAGGFLSNGEPSLDTFVYEHALDSLVRQEATQQQQQQPVAQLVGLSGYQLTVARDQPTALIGGQQLPLHRVVTLCVAYSSSAIACVAPNDNTMTQIQVQTIINDTPVPAPTTGSSTFTTIAVVMGLLMAILLIGGIIAYIKFQKKQKALHSRLAEEI